MPKATEVIEGLQGRREKALQAAEDIQNEADSEGRNMTKEEIARFEDLQDEVEDLEADIERRKRLLKNKAAASKSERRSAPQEPSDPNSLEVADNARVEFPRFRYGKLQSYAGPKAEERAHRVGMWLLWRMYGNQRARDWCLTHGVGPEGEARAMGGDTFTGGGALVPDEMEQAIIDLKEDYGVARQICRVVPMSSDHQVIPRRTSGLTAYPVGDNDSITASDKAWDQVELTARKWAVLAKYSSELSEDAAIQIADDLTKDIAWAFAKKEDECWIDGDGTSTYHGIVGFRVKMIDGSHGGTTVAAATAAHDTFAELDKTDLAKAIGALPEYARANARWVCSSYAYGMVFQRLLAGQGGATMRETEAGTAYSYLGSPITISQAMPSGAGTDYTSEVMMAYGDFSLSTTIGDRRGTRIRVSEDRYLEFDQLAIVGTTRYDVVNHDLGDSSNAGPVIGLMGGSG